MSKNLCGKSLNAGAILTREFEEWECGLRIADCGLRIYEFVQPRTRNRHGKCYQSAIRNPQSAIRNPPPHYSLRDAELPEDESVIERHVVQAVVAPRSPAVTARLQLDLEQEQEPGGHGGASGRYDRLHDM